MTLQITWILNYRFCFVMRRVLYKCHFFFVYYYYYYHYYYLFFAI